MTMAGEYLRRFAAWAIALRERYTTDLFFRTTVHVVALQGLLVALCIGSFLWALGYAGHQINSAVIESVRTLLLDYPAYEAGALPAQINLIQLQSVWLVFAAMVALAVLFGILIARFTLRPARDTLAQQKLFISNVAHELRTPLSTIKTSTEVALLEDALPQGVRKIFQDILGELNRASEIINNLLSLNTLTRPERMKFENIDLGALTDSVIKRHGALAQERGITVACKKDYGIVWGNSSALEQVVTNLLKNALSFTPKGRDGTVTVSIHPDYHGAVVFSISDTGVGIAQKDLFHIFEPFYQASASRARMGSVGGSGLGLTIVNEIVRAHRGKIRIESARNHGTTVSVFLPAGRDAQREDGQSGNQVSLDFSQREGLAAR